MRPALQGLRVKPPSLDLLRYLSGLPLHDTFEHCDTIDYKSDCTSHLRPQRRRGYATLAAAKLDNVEPLHRPGQQRDEEPLPGTTPSLTDKTSLSIVRGDIQKAHGIEGETLAALSDSKLSSSYFTGQLPHDLPDATQLDLKPAGPRSLLSDTAARLERPELSNSSLKTGRLPQKALRFSTESGPHKALPVPAKDVVLPFNESVRRYPNLQRFAHALSADLKWKDELFSSEQLIFESDVASQSLPRARRIVDHPKFVNNLHLWLSLLRFRKRRNGIEGVRAIWKGLRERRVVLSVRPFADELWMSFIHLGLKDEFILDDLIRYADYLYDTSGQSWSRLYRIILANVALHGSRPKVHKWHNILIERHSPKQSHLVQLVLHLIHRGCSPETTRWLYQQNKHRDLYSKIISNLTLHKAYDTALAWHFFLLANKDFPTDARLTEPLTQHYAVYDPRTARRIVSSLVKANVNFGAAMNRELNDNKKISREMMNLIHGQKMNIAPKLYNDSLGARWFATRMISLDLAISSIHALGVEEIGPLSLQAIALRDPDPVAVHSRIRQLKDIGIGVSSSTYTNSLIELAVKRDSQLLKSLLDSDLHPTAYDDWSVVEELLDVASQNRDWEKYRLLLTVRSFSVSHGWGTVETEHRNFSMRNSARKGNTSEIIKQLEQMRVKGIVVTTKTIALVVRSVLRPRAPGKRPVSHSPTRLLDLNLAISVLERITIANGWVPLLVWRELYKRLGMLGHLDDLERLCLWLAKWYKPDSELRRMSTGLTMSMYSSGYIIPSQVSPSNALHPLRILFPSTFQKAIIAWGFIQSASISKPRPEIYRELSMEPWVPIEAPYTRGLRFLRKLSAEGVYIDFPQVRNALYTRLQILFGPGRSNRRRNRTLRMRNRESLGQVVTNINKAWGQEIFTDTESLRAQFWVDYRKALGVKATRLSRFKQSTNVRDS